VRIEVAELGLQALDALRTDAIAVFVGPERPLQGLAGFVDWRLCGAISRAIRGGSYVPEAGESLLLPTGGRLAAPRLFCFGLMSEVPLAGTALAAACERACAAMERAGSTSYAAALPPHLPVLQPAAARAWLEASVRYRVTRQVILGDPRSLHRDLAEAREAVGAVVDLVAPVLRVELPARAGGLPGHGAVLR
jgi:hypothetical protein